MVNNFIWLVFAHSIGDYALQPDRYASNKSTNYRYLFNHCLIYTAILAIFLNVLNLFSMYSILYIFTSHWLIDNGLKNVGGADKKGWVGWLDFSLHLLILGGAIWGK